MPADLWGAMESPNVINSVPFFLSLVLLSPSASNRFGYWSCLVVVVMVFTFLTVVVVVTQLIGAF